MAEGFGIIAGGLDPISSISQGPHITRPSLKPRNLRVSMIPIIMASGNRVKDLLKEIPPHPC